MIKIITVGNLKEKYLKDAVDEYLKRIKKYTNIEIIEIKDEGLVEESKAIELEGEKINKHLTGKEYINDGATQASCDVKVSDEFVEVGSVIDNADALPDNFVAEAVLVDANGNNLCSPYTSIENTRRHEEFEAKDIYSFEGHNVVNFDQDAATNFGVLEDDVKILTAEEVVEEVNEDESKNYTISSPSENIEVGDKVYIKDGAGEYLFKVADKNTLSDGKIFVKAARANDANHGFKIEDFFTYVDVEMEGYGEQGDEYSENEKLDSSYSLRKQK